MAKKFDVAMLGWWYGQNYGSMLTYFALNKAVTNLGYSVVMVHESLGYNGWRVHWAKDIDPMKFAERQGYNITEQQHFSKNSNLNELADTFMVGSDQLWNPNIGRVNDDLFLDFTNDDKKRIAYGTSFGNANKGKFKKEFVEKHSADLKRFDAISVRENYAVDIAKNVFGVDAEQVVDPVFLNDQSEYIKLAENATVRPEGDYLLSFILDPTEEKKRVIKDIANKLGLKKAVVITDASSSSLKIAQEVFVEPMFAIITEVKPENYLYAYQHAKYVVTDSFHGSCFSFIFRKPFSVFYNTVRGADRFKNLMSLFGLSDSRRIFETMKKDDIESNLNITYDIDYVEGIKKIDQNAKKSLNWLKKSLATPKSKDKIISLSPKKENNLNKKITIVEKNKVAKKDIAIPPTIRDRNQIIFDVLNDDKVIEWKNKLAKKLPELLTFIGRELKEYTHNKVGGPADILVFPKNTDEIKKIIEFSQENYIPYTILGNCSNVIIRDGGIRGIVILTTKLNNYFKLEGNIFTAGAGTSLIEATYYLLNRSKANLEWAVGIPGTVGGAVYMNAGTNISDIRRVLKSVKVMNENGEIIILNNSDIEWGKRYTSIQDHKKWVIIEASFDVQDGDKKELTEKMIKTVTTRENHFPLEYPNHGSTFKWWRAPRLIKQAGLAGKKLGGVKISSKQPGFFINFNQATAADYEALIDLTIAKVYEFSGFLMEPEVEIIGERPHKYERYSLDVRDNL